jgi:LacI family transcriptional regulator
LKKGLLIHDIANHLNVSIATVSLVLNGKAKEMRISNTLAVRVRQYVEEVGYKLNQLAKSLRTGKTHVIGLMAATARTGARNRVSAGNRTDCARAGSVFRN